MVLYQHLICLTRRRSSWVQTASDRSTTTLEACAANHHYYRAVPLSITCLALILPIYLSIIYSSTGPHSLLSLVPSHCHTVCCRRQRQTTSTQTRPTKLYPRAQAHNCTRPTETLPAATSYNSRSSTCRERCSNDAEEYQLSHPSHRVGRRL